MIARTPLSRFSAVDEVAKVAGLADPRRDFARLLVNQTDLLVDFCSRPAVAREG